MKNRFLAALLVALACRPSESVPPFPVEAGTRRQALSPWETDELLSSEKRALLSRLAASSTVPVEIETWRRAEVVSRLELSVASGLPAGSTLADHATRFVEQYKGLWDLDHVPAIVGTVENRSCSSVTFQLFDGPYAVFNATLRVTLTPDGVIRTVAGRMSGAALMDAARRDQIQSVLANASAATQAEREFITLMGGDPDVTSGFLNPTPVVFDPFFSANAPRSPTAGFVARFQSGARRSSFVMDGFTWKNRVGGPAWTVQPEDPFACAGSDPTEWYPEVVVDPATHSPSTIRFDHLGGVPTVGPNWEQRARHLMNLPQMKDMFGDRVPDAHLQLDEELDHGGARTVRFREVSAGVVVHGGYVQITFAPSGRAMSVEARWLQDPATDATAGLSESAARALSTTAYLQQECGVDLDCRAALMAEPPVAGELRILSSRLEPLDTLTGDRLVWVFEHRARRQFIDGSTGALLISTPRELNAWASQIINRVPDGGVLLFADGGRTANGAPANEVAEAEALNGMMNSVGEEYRQKYDWRGMKGDAGLVEINHGCPATFGPLAACLAGLNAGYYPRADGIRKPIPNPDGGRSERSEFILLANQGGLHFLGPYIVDDVFAHEWAHGIVDNTALLTGECHGRSLNESYADILAETLRPSDGGAWTIGETLNPAVVPQTVPSRDMRNPEGLNKPYYRSVYNDLMPLDPLPAPYSGPRKCPRRETVLVEGREEQHINADEAYGLTGPPSKAAQLIAEGHAGFAGFGRQATHQFFFELLRQKRVLPSAQIPEQAQIAESSCRNDIGMDGILLPKFDATLARCDLVRFAYDAVGMRRAEQFGWWQGQTSAPSTWQESFNNRRYYRGCTLGTQILRVQSNSGGVTNIDLDDGSIPRRVQLGELVVTVDSRGADTDRTDRTVVVGFSSGWNSTRVVGVSVLETPNLGPGVNSADECDAPAKFHAKTLYSYSYVTVFSQGPFGFSQNDVINSVGTFPPECLLDQNNAGEQTVSGREEWTTPHQYHDPQYPHSIASIIDHGNHGYSVSKTTPPLSMGVTLHSWVNPFSKVSARAAYRLLEQDQKDCVALINQAHPDPLVVLTP